MQNLKQSRTQSRKQPPGLSHFGFNERGLIGAS
jgi:hypothetical protein